MKARGSTLLKRITFPRSITGNSVFKVKKSGQQTGSADTEPQAPVGLLPDDIVIEVAEHLDSSALLRACLMVCFSRPSKLVISDQGCTSLHTMTL
jgi:hypothetical protein